MEPLPTMSDPTALTRLLPTCQRCRRLRRKCDTSLPSCRLCDKAKSECTFFDHALQLSLPRAYVQSLMTRLDRLKAVQSSITDASAPPPAPAPPLDAPRRDSTAIQPHFLLSPPGASTTTAQTTSYPTLSFDKHFLVPNQQGSGWQFYGASSVFVLTVEVLAHAEHKLGSIMSLDALDTRFWPNYRENEQIGSGIRDKGAIEKLLQVYMSSSNIMYGFIDEMTLSDDLDAYMDLRNRVIDFSTLRGQDAHRFYRISMICAIACANISRYQTWYGGESLLFHSEAIKCLEEVTSEVSVESLQALLLLNVFGQFYPQKCDIWKLLDYACRLSVELGYHTEHEFENEDEIQRIKRRRIFWGLYAMERIAGQLFGRPADLLESNITTEYPTATSANQALESLSISHHYRLVYLRSEIYQDLYLPAVPPNYPTDWYRDRLMMIVAWMREVQVSDNLTGPASVTCETGYNATVIFLFQPLMLHALAATQDPDYINEGDTVPSDNYHCACELIRCYEKLLRAPQNSPYGTYPMTYISAHYIQIAGMTIMAHCLLALDGRVPVMRSIADPTQQGIDFSDLYGVSGSCLILLTWCAEKFPGMIGMLDMYKKLSEKVLPLLMRRMG